MKIYIRAYWFDDNNEAIDDFIYGRNKYAPKEASKPENFVTDIAYEDVDYNDYDDDSYYDSEYEDFYNQIKRRKIFVPTQVAHDIADYNAYRRNLFGTLCLSMQSGESIEALYYELRKDFPGIINDDCINQSDMLLEIVDATLYAQNILTEHCA